MQIFVFVIRTCRFGIRIRIHKTFFWVRTSFSFALVLQHQPTQSMLHFYFSCGSLFRVRVRVRQLC